MLSKDSVKRPSAKVVLNHPFFWNEERMLGFLQVKFNFGSHFCMFDENKSIFFVGC